MCGYLKLKDICTVFTDGDWIETKDQSSDGIRLVQTGNVKTGYFADREDKARYISEETFERLNCTEVKEGDILVSRLPEPVGRGCIVPYLAEKLITAVDCTIIRTTESVLPEYLNYYMQSPQYFLSVKDKVTGATRQRISRKNLGDIDIFVPPLAAQQRIVAKLDAAFAEIDRAVEMIYTKKIKSEILKSALLRMLLADEATAWRTVKIGDVCNIINGSTPSRKDAKYWADGDVSWFTIDDMREQGRDIFTTAQHVTSTAVKDKKVKIIPANSVLLCCTASIGEVAIARKEMATNQQFNSLTPLTEELSCEYLYYVATTLKDKLLSVSGSTTISFVSMGKLKDIEILLPPLVEQKRLVEKLDVVFSCIEAFSSAAAATEERYGLLKSAILTQELQPSEAS